MPKQLSNKGELILGLVTKALLKEVEEEGVALLVQALLVYTSLEIVLEELILLKGYSSLSTLLEEVKGIKDEEDSL